MKQGKNILQLEGILLEKKVVGEGTGKAGRWKKIELLIRDKKGSEIPVIMMQSEFGKDKNKNQIENSAFKGLETIINEYKTVASHGLEEADRVSITRGSISKNVYKNRNNELAEIVNFETRYIKRIEEERELLDCAVLTLSGVIHKKLPTNGGTELIVRFLVPNFKGEVEYFDFKVTNPEGVAYFEEEITSGQSLEIDVDFDYLVKEEEVEVKRNFGGTKIEKTFKRIKNLEIIGVTELIGEDEWQEEEIVTAVKELEKRYQNILEAPAKKPATAPSNSGQSTQFGKGKSTPVDSGDMPF